MKESNRQTENKPCPYCGAEWSFHRRSNNTDYWKCQTSRGEQGKFYEGELCIRRQRDALREEVKELKKRPEKLLWDVAANPTFWRHLKKERKRILKRK